MKRTKINTRLHLERLELRDLLAANVLVVSDPAGASNQPDDVDLLNTLIAGGNTIDADSGPFTAAPPTPAQLADVDLIVVSRTTSSGMYNQTGEAAAWNGLNVPMIVMAPHVSRSSHWGLFASTTVTTDSAAPTTYNAFPNAAHPFVAGLTTSFAPAGLQIDSMNSTAIPAGATIVATITVGGGSHAAVVDIPAGAVSFATSGGTFGNRRVFFTLPDYPDKPAQDFDDVTTANSRDILLRIVDELTANPYEAELATLSGPTIETLNAGFTGTGYADVDGADFLAWQRNLGQPVGATRGQGDSNQDGAVNAADLAVWRTQFGQTPTIAAAVAIEPPSTGTVGAQSAALPSAVLSRRDPFTDVAALFAPNSAAPRRQREPIRPALPRAGFDRALHDLRSWPVENAAVMALASDDPSQLAHDEAFDSFESDTWSYLN